MEEFEANDVTLREVLDGFGRWWASVEDEEIRGPMNFVLDTHRLSEFQLNTRFTIKVKKSYFFEVLHTLAVKLRLSYRWDSHAIIVSDRSRFGLGTVPAPRPALLLLFTRQPD